MVTIDVWRARIGGHHARCSGYLVQGCVQADTLIFVAVFHFLICLCLLVIGNVELNPGPDGFKCSFCQTVSASIGAHCFHQKIHANIPNYFYECGEPTCRLQYSTFRSLNSHISKVHKSARSVTHSVEIEFHPCIYCPEGSSSKVPESLQELIHHILKNHVVQDGNVTCPLSSQCGRVEPFATTNAFSGHLSKYHAGWRCPKNVTPEDVQSSDSANDPNAIGESDGGGIPLFDGDYDSECDNDTDEFYDAEETSFSQKDIFEFIARFYVMLEVECQMPERKIQIVCEFLTYLSEMVNVSLRQVLHKELEALQVHADTIHHILCKLSSNNPFYLAHHKGTLGPDLTSGHLRDKHFKDYFPQVPVSFPNFIPKDSVDGDRYAYVSVKDSLTCLFKDASVQREVVASFARNAVAQNSNGTVLSDYIDGEVCKGRNLPPERIDLLIFQDGFSVTSMLTTVQKKHKTMGVYFTIGNLRSCLRTKLKAMHLIELVLEAHCRKYRQHCWKKLKDELKDLERTGIDFDGKIIPVCVQFFIGDNLGSHFLGGFVESFTASHFCRYCEVSKAELKADPSASKPPRTQQRYNLCALKAHSTKKKHCFGVKENSVFNELQNFKICDPGLPPCLGHDLFHGVIEWDLRAIIDALILKKWFSLDLLNRRIANFKYSAWDGKNKPAPLCVDLTGKKKKNRLGGSAVQNWQLLQLLPLIIQDLIKDVDDPHWKLYLKLKKMCELVCAPKISLDQIDLLESIQDDYFTERPILLKNEKPKHHYFRHYGQLIRKFGPLIHLWAMRFEQKHQFFKKTARTCNNFVNILKTLSHKCQLLFAFESKGLRFPETKLDFNRMDIDSMALPQSVCSAITAQNLNESTKATKQITIDGLKYKQGSLLVLSSISSSDNIRVGWIEVILMEGTAVLFVLKNTVAKFNAQMGLYCLDSSSGFVTVINQNELPYPCPLSIYSIIDDDDTEIDVFSLKHSIV